MVVVTAEKALLWTDGRYHLQASKQLEPTIWTLMRQGSTIYFLFEMFVSFSTGNDGVPSPEEWLAKYILKGELIGFDPHLFSHHQYLKYSKVTALVSQVLVA